MSKKFLYFEFNDLMDKYLARCLCGKLQDDLYGIFDIYIESHKCGVNIYLNEDGFDFDNPQDSYLLIHLHSSDLIFSILDYKNLLEKIRNECFEKSKELELRNEITKE